MNKTQLKLEGIKSLIAYFTAMSVVLFTVPVSLVGYLWLNYTVLKIAQLSSILMALTMSISFFCLFSQFIIRQSKLMIIGRL